MQHKRHTAMMLGYATTTTTAATRVVHCNPQSAYKHGMFMCTTACMHVAMGVICRKMRLAGDSDAALRSKLDSIMALASRCHGSLQADGIHRMLSVHDIVLERRLNMRRLGVQMEELMLADRLDGETTAAAAAGGASCCCCCCGRCPLRTAKDRGVMKFQAPSCFVQASQIPCCLITADPGQCSVALATSNGHTVCLAYYWDDASASGRFALFDPLPGRMTLCMDGSQLIESMQCALKMVDAPTAAADRLNPLHPRQCDVTLLYMTGGQPQASVA